ncbi:hypothetical protein DL96DRAFT_1610346 [Flagelloscypha sp. PMI_526]|nr:hypothetical protein DL96DRAFT_1610346 [Flagelloscypha sp. PMI_526]
MLPQELISIIVRHFDPFEDVDTLRSCCLVAAIFFEVAQPVLFSSVVFWPVAQPQEAQIASRFLNLIINSSHIAPMVKRVAVHRLSITDDEAEAFESLTSLRSLSFGTLGEYWPKMSLKTQDVLRSKVIPRLHHLWTDFLVPEMFPCGPLEYLQLSTHRVGQAAWTHPLPQSKMLKVSCLDLRGDVHYSIDPTSPDKFFHLKFIDLTSIESMIIGVYPRQWPLSFRQSWSCYRSLLSGASINLKSLTWGITVFRDINWDFFRDTFDFLELQFLPVLEVLAIEFPKSFETHERCLRWLTNHF